MVFTRNLQQTGECLRIAIHPRPYLIRDMLVDQHNGYVFALLGEGVEGGFDGVLFCFGVDD